MSDLPLNQILCGDCVEVLKDFPDNSIDLVVTDPPYGLSFMGKDWDKTLPPQEAFDEIIRVLKPGALTFVMSSPRQDVLWRMLALLEGVGFELTQSYIEWIYKTGFPKAYDVSKGMDSKFGLRRNRIGSNPHVKGRKTRTGGSILAAGAKRTLGSNDSITEPQSPLAKRWEGWKSQTGLKPAHEPILMVNKPFSESTIVDNVLKWGTGAINVEACRIPYDGMQDPRIGKQIKYGEIDYVTKFGQIKSNMICGTEKGRFPANLLVSDKAIDTGENTRSGSKYSERKSLAKREGTYSGFQMCSGEVNAPNSYGDEGGASRYFDLDAWAKHHGFLDVPKPDTSERDFGLKGKKRIPTSKLNLSDGKNPVRLDGVISKPRRNIHPTVKPIKLMAYLIELGCPPNGVVLDPFVGSGTTCIAAKQLVRKYIGIEINPEYHALAKSRIEAYPVPLSWFSESETEDVLVPPNSFKGDAK